MKLTCSYYPFSDRVVPLVKSIMLALLDLLFLDVSGRDVTCYLLYQLGTNFLCFFYFDLLFQQILA